MLLIRSVSKDGELFENERDVRIDCSSVVVKGELKRPAWDPVDLRQKLVYGLYFQYEGSEYATLCMTAQQLLDYCNGVGNCCDGDGPDSFRIHVEQFTIQFV